MEEYPPSEWVDEGVAGLLVDDRHELAVRRRECIVPLLGLAGAMALTVAESSLPAGVLAVGEGRPRPWPWRELVAGEHDGVQALGPVLLIQRVRQGRAREGVQVSKDAGPSGAGLGSDLAE